MTEINKRLQTKQGLFKVSCGLLTLVFIIFSAVACSDNDDPIPSPTASFTFEADEDDPLTIHFTNTSENHNESTWEFGDGIEAEDQGVFQLEQSGTHYFVIKSGTWQGTLGPDGVTITNVSLQQVE